MRPALLLPTLLLLAGCGGADPQVPAPSTPSASAPAPRTTPPTPERSDAGRPHPRPTPELAPAPALEPARCAADAGATCTAVTGLVLLIESVDPDGDGDLHVVVRGGKVTAPGVSVLDVSAALRPARDPRVGDRVTGAGPVFRGSFGQRQVQVTTFRVARAAG